MLYRLTLAACLSLLVPPSWGQESVPLSVDDELDRVEPSEPAISPDGSRIVFVRSELDWKENERKTHLVRISLADGESIDFTRGPSDRAPAWSPDGRYVAFVRKSGEKRKAKNQIWVIAADGGEAFRVTELSEGVLRFVWSPDSEHIVLVAKDPMDEAAKKRLEDGDDAIYVFEGPNGQGRDRWSNLWIVSIADREPRQITHEKMLVSDLNVSPDGEHAAFIFRRENARNNGNLAEVGMVRLDGAGGVTRLTENQAPESHPRFAPDGRHLGFLAPGTEGWDLRQDRLYLLDLETRETRWASAGFSGVIRDFRFTGDSDALLVAGVRTDMGIYRLRVDEDGDGDVETALGAPGVARDVSFSSDGTQAAFVWSDATTPPEIATATLEAGKAGPVPRIVTDLNPELHHRALASVELIRWKSRDGLEIEGLLYLPPDRKENEPLPLILEIHGGPAGVFTRSWRGGRHIYGGLGYAVLAPNVRGSSAYGDDLLRGNMHDLGGGDFDDLMTGVDAVIARGIADPEHLGVRGWSYGGILGGWVVTHTNRFRAASLGAMVSDWRSEYGQGFNYDVRLWYIGGDPWSNPEAYLARSALTHVQNVTTPTLLLHGEQDTTDTIEQTMNFFNALWEKGTKTRFIRFPREGHGIREPRHQRLRLVEEIAWMERYVRDREWSPPARPEKPVNATTENP